MGCWRIRASRRGGPRQSLLKAQGKYDEAEPLYREALKVRREVLGDRHEVTLASIGNLADLLRERGQLDAASAELGDAVAVATEVLGADHLGTLVTVAKAARLTLAQTGNVEPARRWGGWRRAREGACTDGQVREGGGRGGC